MTMEDFIVFTIVMLAVLYLAYYIFKKKGCGCDSGGSGKRCTTESSKECCGDEDNCGCGH